jgi:hypothetical protein
MCKGIPERVAMTISDQNEKRFGLLQNRQQK